MLRVEVEEQTFASEAEPIVPRFIFPKQQRFVVKFSSVVYPNPAGTMRHPSRREIAQRMTFESTSPEGEVPHARRALSARVQSTLIAFMPG